MAETGVLLTILGLAVALPGIGASSFGPWFCYRLVPASITSAKTPCMFPCLFISPHEHPHIVVHNEVDGTPCTVTSGSHYETKDGRCSSGVCTVNIGPPVLKRKKRFICLFTLASLLKAKRERKLLRNELEALKRLTLLNHHRRVSDWSRGTARLSNLDTLRGEVSRGSSASSTDRNVVEIHVVAPGADGIGANYPGLGSSGSVDLGNRVGGINLGGNVRSGVAGHPGFVNLGFDRRNGGRSDFTNERIGNAVGESRIPGGTDISVTTDSGSPGVFGGGLGSSGTRVVANIGMGPNGAGGTIGGNSVATAVTTSTGTSRTLVAGIGGHSGMHLENRGSLGTSSSAIGGRSSAASVVGIAGVGVTNGNYGRVGPGSVRRGAGVADARSVAGISGVVSTAATGVGNNERSGVGSVGASHVVGSTPNGPGLGGARSLFPSSGGRFSGGGAGRGSGVEFESASSRGNEIFGPTGGTGDSYYSGGFWGDAFASGDDFAGEDGF